MRSAHRHTRLLLLILLLAQAGGCAVARSYEPLHPRSTMRMPKPTPSGLTGVLPEGVQVATDPNPHRVRIYEPPEWDPETTRLAGMITTGVVVTFAAAWSVSGGWRW